MKKLMKLLPVLMLTVFVFTSVYAQNVNNLSNLTSGMTGSTIVGKTAGGLWATVVTIVQILAVAAVVFAGLRYMFASADQKADIKKSMGTLAIGAVLVFGATTVIKFVSNATNQIIR